MDRYDDRSDLIELGTATDETRGAAGLSSDQKLNQPVPGLDEA